MAILRNHPLAPDHSRRPMCRRYRRQDEIGTRSASPVNFGSLNDQAVTVRERDSMQQVRIGIGALEGYLAEPLAGCGLPQASQQRRGAAQVFEPRNPPTLN